MRLGFRMVPVRIDKARSSRKGDPMHLPKNQSSDSLFAFCAFVVSIAVLAFMAHCA
jgi:hypothetical protein